MGAAACEEMGNRGGTGDREVGSELEQEPELTGVLGPKCRRFSQEEEPLPEFSTFERRSKMLMGSFIYMAA